MTDSLQKESFEEKSTVLESECSTESNWEKLITRVDGISIELSQAHNEAHQNCNKNIVIC